jgi:hypothetical protein
MLLIGEVACAAGEAKKSTNLPFVYLRFIVLLRPYICISLSRDDTPEFLIVPKG